VATVAPRILDGECRRTALSQRNSQPNESVLSASYGQRVAESGKQMLTIQYSIARLSRRPAPCFLGLRFLCPRITRDKPNRVRPWAKIMSPPTSRSRRGWLYADTSLPRYFRRSPLRMSMSAASPRHSSNISAFEFALQCRGYYCLSKR
jgi:hypothetical protein